MTGRHRPPEAPRQGRLHRAAVWLWNNPPAYRLTGWLLRRRDHSVWTSLARELDKED